MWTWAWFENKFEQLNTEVNTEQTKGMRVDIIQGEEIYYRRLFLEIVNNHTHFDFVALWFELSIIYILEGLNKNRAIELWKSIKMYGLDQACPETMKLCELYLTILVINAASDRDFSPKKK